MRLQRIGHQQTHGRTLQARLQAVQGVQYGLGILAGARHQAGLQAVQIQGEQNAVFGQRQQHMGTAGVDDQRSTPAFAALQQVVQLQLGPLQATGGQIAGVHCRGQIERHQQGGAALGKRQWLLEPGGPGQGQQQQREQHQQATMAAQATRTRDQQIRQQLGRDQAPPARQTAASLQAPIGQQQHGQQQQPAGTQKVQGQPGVHQPSSATRRERPGNSCSNSRPSANASG